MQRVVEDDVAELQMMHMIEGKTKNPDVLHAVAIIIKDHSAHVENARGLCEQFGIEAPVKPDAIHRAIYEHMSKQTGSGLNKSITADQLQDHIADVNTSESEIESGSTLTIRQFAKSSRLMFARHEQVWRGVAKKIGVPSTFGRRTAAEILSRQ
jgi:hypothetical protein